MRKTVRVELPTSSPDDFLVLIQAIIAKHTKDGAGSPLDAKKMATLSALCAAATAKNQEAKTADAAAQQARQMRDTALGLAKSQTTQTPDTGLALATYVRDQLLLTYKGTEEALSAYGFEVVVGSAKTATRAKKPAA